MTACLALAVIGLLLACLSAVTFAGNLRRFARLRHDQATPLARLPISVLIPARNEQATIRHSVETVLASHGVDFEVIVLDDHSSDDTAAIVAEVANRDRRLRLVPAPPLPDGWCGKQHACHVLSQLARYDLLIWLDADVRLRQDALARIVDEMTRRPVGLLSGFPHEETGSWLEKLLIPLIHFILLGFLPLGRMRLSRSPAFAAGCGQLFIAQRSAYESAGGHAAIRSSLHDGILLPRAFRRAGQTTDVFDATNLAECRMYRSAKEVWLGLLKNAGEGMASPGAIVPWTIVLALGQVLPPFLAVWLGLFGPAGVLSKWTLAVSVVATGISLGIRFVAAARYRQPWISALLHPLGIALLLAIQWESLILRLTGRRRIWKGRSYG